MKKGALIFIALIACCLFAGAGRTETGITAFVSIMPQAYFLERIGGQRVDVEVLVGEGHSPATYEPSPQQMARLSSAKAYFAIGAPFEKNLMNKIRQTHRKLFIVETQRGVPYRYLDDHRNDRGKDTSGGRSDRVPDPHIWMDPKLVKVQARNICEALCGLDPANAKAYSGNLKAFLSDLDRIDQRIASMLAPLKGSNMYVFHPAFGYFADSYGLHQVPVEIEGKEPGARQLAGIIERAKRDRVRVIFVQPQFSTKSAETIAKAIGGAVVPINPLSRDYLSNLGKMASEVEKGLYGR
ncbi:MAG TPA: zinc ABC transporter substrate-binding protein [Syntrophorhabdaceae bacterium]|nr:zinc ABC transporter substrate-binding protein [Syntrophorhabdaceae bacterium]HQM81695.1 zinc ABC transporter substrate-binding protein [Syntrophorhabdaceae bacterium]